MPVIGCTKENNCRRLAYLRARMLEEEGQQKEKRESESKDGKLKEATVTETSSSQKADDSIKDFDSIQGADSIKVTDSKADISARTFLSQRYKLHDFPHLAPLESQRVYHKFASFERKISPGKCTSLGKRRLTA
ncbi:uncharacterized protein LOC144472329 [Augochlora pura]